ncbi:MAG: alanine--tRNA ligase-related protein, partial [Patescibacteria group bacterium]
MQSQEIRERFLRFFEKRGHAVIPSASLVPENDPSVLFTTAGMQPLVPYLLGAKHPAGKRLVNVQKCVRTGDLDDIGDNRHFSFFQMLGNWSLGDYFKEEAIAWSYEFITSKEEGLGLDPSRLYVTTFVGDENAPEDTESPKIWQKLGVPTHRIYSLGAEDNLWSPGDNGPCGPDSEMFYDLTDRGLGDLSMEEF